MVSSSASSKFSTYAVGSIAEEAELETIKVTAAQTTDIKAGSSVQLSMVFSTSGNAVTNGQIRWQITSKTTDSRTVIDENGLLIIGANETASSITVEAISALEPNVPYTYTLTLNHNRNQMPFIPILFTTYLIHAEAGEGGTITPEGITAVMFNNDKTYRIKPDDGYEIAAVIVDGEDIGPVEVYTFKTVAEEHTITALFTEIVPELPAEEEDEWINPFTDLDEDDWYYDDVRYVNEKGIMGGTSDDTFGGENPTTKWMAAVILWRLDGSPVVNYALSYSDVDTDVWYTDALRWAVSEGIITGDGTDKLNPESPVTREQIAVMFMRYAQSKGLTSEALMLLIPPYEYSIWAEAYVIMADSMGLFDGLGIDVYDLTEEADRAELAAYLHRLCEALSNEG